MIDKRLVEGRQPLEKAPALLDAHPGRLLLSGALLLHSWASGNTRKMHARYLAYGQDAWSSETTIVVAIVSTSTAEKNTLVLRN